MVRTIPLLALCLFAPCCERPAAPRAGASGPDAPALIQPLIDPAKLATLGDRGANPRIQKITAGRSLWPGTGPATVPEVVAAQKLSKGKGDPDSF